MSYGFFWRLYTMNKPWVIVVVIVALVVVVAFQVKKMGGADGPPAAIRNAKHTKIDSVTNKEVIQTWQQWRDLGTDKATGYYKHPETGEYTIAAPMECADCKKQIASPKFVDIGEAPSGEMGPDATAEETQAFEEKMQAYEDKRMEADMKRQKEYMCPLCKKNAYQQVEF
jgi:hypothetical protein